MKLEFFCDDQRHLVCVPFSVENLHIMASRLGIKRCWFHAHPRHPHYDIPVRRLFDISGKCKFVTPQDILAIIKGEYRHE